MPSSDWDTKKGNKNGKGRKQRGREEGSSKDSNNRGGEKVKRKMESGKFLHVLCLIFSIPRRVDDAEKPVLWFRKENNKYVNLIWTSAVKTTLAL